MRIMNRRELVSRQLHSKWWGLYLLAPLAAFLLFLDGRLRAGAELHEALALGIVAVICGAALVWTERNSDIVEQEGVDARPAELEWRSAGVLVTGPSAPAIAIGRRRAAARSQREQSALRLDQTAIVATPAADSLAVTVE
jgi:hypothetical protein